MMGRVGTSSTRVLVVDDEPSLLDAVSTALRYEGFEVDTADTGRGALESFARFAPSLVVLDVMLPDLDGLDVCRRLRSDDRAAPVLFLTGKATVPGRVTGRAAGDTAAIPAGAPAPVG